MKQYNITRYDNISKESRKKMLDIIKYLKDKRYNINTDNTDDILTLVQNDKEKH